MMWTVRQLGAPVRYLMISQGSGLFTSKRTYDFVLPLLLGGGTTFIVHHLHVGLGMFGEKGLIPNVINLLNLLIAFFIAALAAVATFDRAGLDDRLKGEPAILKRKNARGVRVDYILTHRQFVCYLFGYLSFASIMLLLGLYGVSMFGDQIQAIIGTIGLVMQVAKGIGALVFFFALYQLTINMLLGIYFLCDRLQFMDDNTV